MYLTPAPETAVYCIPATKCKEGTKVPRKCLPGVEDKDQGVEEEAGSRCGSLAEGDPATENWAGERGNSCLHSPRWRPASPEAQGWCPCLGVAIVSSDTVHRRRSRVQLRMHLKPNQHISCGLFSHVWRHQGNGPPGVIPCHYVLLLKARKVYFSVTQWRHTPARRRKKSKDTHER